MTLVTAAADAIMQADKHLPVPDGVAYLYAECALAAAFAVLPECEEARQIKTAILDAYGSVQASGTAPSPAAVVDAVLVALAWMVES